MDGLTKINQAMRRRAEERNEGIADGGGTREEEWMRDDDRHERGIKAQEVCR